MTHEESDTIKIEALVGFGGTETAVPKAGDIRVVDFEGASVRGRFHKKEWWLSIVDVIAALGVSSRASKYWTDLRTKLIEQEGFSELSDKIGKLKMPSEDGKMRGTDAVNVETLLRVLQSVPSPKVELLKQWLARVGFERLQEVKDPSKALERLINAYLTQGRTPQWIRERIDGILTRRELTDEWRDRGITKAGEFAKLTRTLQTLSLGLGPKEHRELKGIEVSASLRDHSTEMELILTRLGERSTIEIARARDAIGYEQNRDAAKAGGSVAKNARLDIEKLTGRPVASKENFLPKPPTAITGPDAT